MMKERDRLSFWQIWNMSFGFFGVQFGMGLQLANMSAIYQFLGAKESDIPLLWLAAPMTGLIVQPIVGYMSDRTWTPLGRRRPYFLVGAILSSLALIAMPNSGALWMAAGLLWILDASLNITMEPFRAFVGDLLPGTQRKVGFAMQSVMIGGGAVLASMLPFILKEGFGVSGEATADSAIPPVFHLAFYIGALVVFLAVVYTVLTTGEHPPEDMEAFQRMKEESSGLGHAFKEIYHGIASMPDVMKRLAVVQFFTWFALFCMWIYFPPAVGKNIFGGQPLGVEDKESAGEFLESPEGSEMLARATSISAAYESLKDEIDRGMATEEKAKDGPLAFVLRMFGLMPSELTAAERITPEQIEGIVQNQLGQEVAEGGSNKKNSPFVKTVASVLKKHEGNPEGASEAIAERLQKARDYQEGAAWGGVCFSAYNLIAFLFAFLLLGLVEKMSAKKIHFACLLLGGVGLASTGLIESRWPLLVSMVGVGIAWASILSMPYAMLSNVLPPEKMGFYMGVFNFFIVLPQILASVGLGPLMKFAFDGNAIAAVILGGGSMLVAMATTVFIDEEATEHAVATTGSPE